jgi:hypothetical protein
VAKEGIVRVPVEAACGFPKSAVLASPGVMELLPFAGRALSAAAGAQARDGNAGRMGSGSEEKRSSFLVPSLARTAFFSPIGGQDNAFRRVASFSRVATSGNSYRAVLLPPPPPPTSSTAETAPRRPGGRRPAAARPISAGRALPCLSLSKLGTAWTQHPQHYLPVSPAALAVPGAPGGSRPETCPLFTGQRARWTRPLVSASPLFLATSSTPRGWLGREYWNLHNNTARGVPAL